MSASIFPRAKTDLLFSLYEQLVGLLDQSHATETDLLFRPSGSSLSGRDGSSFSGQDGSSFFGRDGSFHLQSGERLSLGKYFPWGQFRSRRLLFSAETDHSSSVCAASSAIAARAISSHSAWMPQNSSSSLGSNFSNDQHHHDVGHRAAQNPPVHGAPATCPLLQVRDSAQEAPGCGPTCAGGQVASAGPAGARRGKIGRAFEAADRVEI